MKKNLMMLFAALTLSIAANAAPVTAFCDKYDSMGFYEDNGKIYQLNGGGNRGSFICEYRKNPYANSKMCAPDMNWATCYEYCFSYNGKTYFFNLN